MKKKIMIVAIAGVLISVLTTFSIYGAVTNTLADYIGEAKATEIAQNEIKKADKAEQKVVKAKFEIDDGVAEYDITIVAGNNKYEYEIDAVSGTIIGREVKMIKVKATAPTTKPAQTKPTNKTAKPTTSNANYIGEEKAKAIVLEFAGISADDAVFVKCKLDREDGIYVYEIEFYANKYEYEAEVDAVTGMIVDFEIDD